MSDPASHPEGGVDYPRTLTEFDAWFVIGDGVCGVSWACSFGMEGFRCPTCCGTDAWPSARGQLRCNRCQRQTSVTAGTFFESTRKSNATLVRGDVVRDQAEARGQCARPATHSWPGQLSDRLGLAAQVAARQRLRPGRDLLGGAVEVDKTYVGGRETGVVGLDRRSPSRSSRLRRKSLEGGALARISNDRRRGCRLRGA